MLDLFRPDRFSRQQCRLRPVRPVRDSERRTNSPPVRHQCGWHLCRHPRSPSDHARQGSGTIVNVASLGGLIALPLFSLYNATKFAVVGFTEALSYELAPLGIRQRRRTRRRCHRFRRPIDGRDFRLRRRQVYGDTLSRVATAMTGNRASPIPRRSRLPRSFSRQRLTVLVRSCISRAKMPTRLLFCTRPCRRRRDWQ